MRSCLCGTQSFKGLQRLWVSTSGTVSHNTSEIKHGKKLNNFVGQIEVIKVQCLYFLLVRAGRQALHVNSNEGGF
jgi:hypothetical protein